MRKPTALKAERPIEALPTTLERVVKFHYTAMDRYQSTAGNEVLQQFINNGMYDFDSTGGAGNIQPQGYDQWIGSAGSGKYQRYNVEKWYTYLEIMNFSSAPVIFFYVPHHETLAECNTALEAQSYPNSKQAILQYYAGGASNSIKWKSMGESGALLPHGSRNTLSGVVGANPSTISCSTIVAKSPSAAAIDCYIKVHHIFVARLSALSAVVS